MSESEGPICGPCYDAKLYGDEPDENCQVCAGMNAIASAVRGLLSEMERRGSDG